MTNDLNRAHMLDVIGLLRPALATADYIPALTHVHFDGEFATAYNDISAVSIKCETPFKRCVPGELLAKALTSMLGERVAVAFNKTPGDGTLLLSSGRSKLKVPTLPAEDYPFAIPADDGPEVPLTARVVKGIEMCLAGVGADKTHPEQCGVTLGTHGGTAVLYSTDGMTLSRYSTDEEVELPGDAPVILPTFFCERIVALARGGTYGTLVLLPGALVAELGNAVAYTKTLVDLEPAHFERPLSNVFPGGYVADGMAPVPDLLDAAIDRALLVLQREVVRTTRFEVSNGTLRLHSTSAMGDADDDMPFGIPSAITVKADPSDVARALRQCDRIGFTPRAVVLAGDEGRFLHAVAAVSK